MRTTTAPNRLHLPIALLLFTAITALPCPVASAQRVPPPNWTQQREFMVEDAVQGAGVRDTRVVAAMRKTPRHMFVPESVRQFAYEDIALPIGDSQTISPPFIVAWMTEKLDPQPTDRVLEIGTGSGYQAAVLSPLVDKVYSIEIVEPLGKQAAKTLQRLGFTNVETRIGDGFKGWPEHAPFDKIIVTCSPEQIPQPLIDQLKEGGRMIIPVGERYCQTFQLATKKDGKLDLEPLMPTLFVPMTGQAESQREVLPDAENPSIHNGDFELAVGDTDLPLGWHYLRRADRLSAIKNAHYFDTKSTDQQNESPDERTGHFMRFYNVSTGRPAQILQGLPVDGSKISHLRLAARVAGINIRQGRTPYQQSAMVVGFYDKDRNFIGTEVLGPWRGTFDWRDESKIVEVPKDAREAVVRVGLLGATGTLLVDDVSLKPILIESVIRMD